MVAHILDDVVNSSLFLSCVVSHCFPHLPTPHLHFAISWVHLSLSTPKVKHLTRDSPSSSMQFDLVKQNHHFFFFFGAFLLLQLPASVAGVTLHNSSCMQCSLKRIMIISGLFTISCGS